jgi:NADPH:quinone reductase-like Zn-dependent oxidoreductase
MRRHAAGASGFIAPEEKRDEAFVMHRIGDLGVPDKPGPNDALVRTTAALICASDTHTVGGGIGERTNLTLGHEAMRVIAKLGSAGRGFTSQCTQKLGGWKFANLRDGRGQDIQRLRTRPAWRTLGNAKRKLGGRAALGSFLGSTLTN